MSPTSYQTAPPRSVTIPVSREGNQPLPHGEPTRNERSNSPPNTATRESERR